MPPPPGADAPANPPPAAVCAALPRVSQDLLWLVDAAGKVLWCNPTVGTLLGRGLDALAGLAWTDALPAAPADLDALNRAAAQLQTGHAFADLDVEIVFVARAPAWLRISAQSLPPENNDASAGARWLLSMRDITDTRHFEREAGRLRELLEMAQEFGRIGVWERDIPSGAGRWDRHVFGFWGLDASGATPSYDEAISRLHPEDRARMAYLESTRQAGRYTQRYRIFHPDGRTRWIQSQWEVKNSPSGHPDRAIGILMDDSEVYEHARSLVDTNAQLEMAVALGNIAIWRHDLRTDRVNYNDRAQEVFDVPGQADGVSLEEMRDRVHPDDRGRLAVAAQQAASAETPTDIEARFRRRDGSYRTLLTRRVVERAADGSPRAFVGIALDVTAQADERRRTTGLMHRMETAAAAAGVGIWSYDPATGEAQWNEPMFALVGRSPTLGAPSRREWYEEVIHPTDRERVRSERAALDTRADGAGEHQFRVTRANGEIRWLENRMRREVLDGRPTILGVTLDITERRRAEEALRNADERAALAAREVGIGTWESDLVAHVERWDEQMYRLRGIAPREHPPARDERLAMLHPDDRQLVIDARAGGASEPQPAQYEFRVQWPDGSWHWLASRSILLQDEAGRALRRIGVNWDITESKRVEAARQDSALVHRANLAKSQFLGRVSHELRTPLNAVLGFTQLLLADGGISGSQRERLGLIASAGEHLLLLINDVLDLTGLETGELRLDLQPVSLAALVGETVPLIEPFAAGHGVVLRIDALDGVALADRTRLRQVLTNLLSNGIKYNRAQGWVSISATSAAGRVTLRVGDSGRGMARDQVAHLFEPFNRLGAEREGIEGSGIGLTIVKTLVERMGGTVSVTSRPGEGTCFSVELPAAPPALRTDPGVPPASALPPLPVARAGRLLYIEDNSVNMLLVQELVALRPGIEMIGATTGEQGVRQAMASKPALVLVDMQLPDFDGFEVLRRLRADPRTAALRCVALSANALPEDISRALTAGFAEYWTKPIHFGGFLAALDAAFAPGPGQGR